MKYSFGILSISEGYIQMDVCKQKTMFVASTKILFNQFVIQYQTATNNQIIT